MAPSQTFGPFLDEHGLLIWFDFFFPTLLVQVFLQGSATPALLIPLWGALTGKKSFSIEAGSAWIASGLIAKTAALNGFYTGLKIKGGSLDLSHAATISSGTIVIPSTTRTCTLISIRTPHRGGRLRSRCAKTRSSCRRPWT